VTTAFDIRHPEFVLQELGDMSRRVTQEREVPQWIGTWLADVCTAIGETPATDLEGIAEHDWASLQAAALRLAGAVFHADNEDPHKLRRRVRLGIEELKFRMARLAEAQPVNDSQPIRAVAAWLDKSLDLTQAAKAELFGISERTWQRWTSEHEPAEPTGDTATKVRLLARVVNELRHVMTATGSARWAQKPLPDLGGLTPLQAFGEADPELIGKVFTLIAAARAGAAA
jgi:hypothetical protein